MKPITKTNDDRIEEIVNRRVSNLDEKLERIASMTNRIKEETKEIKEKDVDNIVDKIMEKTIDKQPKKIETEHSHDDVSCPTCGDGHIHKIIGNGLTAKCTGKNCGEEYVLVPKSADYKCENCGIPVKKPPKDKKIESCPFCGGGKAALFDYKKLIKKNKSL